MKTKEEMDELLKNVAVHCETEDESNQVLDLADKLGYKWRTGKSFKIVDNYQYYYEWTCYYILEGTFDRKTYFEREQFHVISAQEFIKMVNEENKMENKDIKTEVDINSLIPEGYEIDKENSTLECIKFKKKKLTYEDVANKLFSANKAYYLLGDKIESISPTDHSCYWGADNCTSEKQAMKLAATNKLLNVAKYLNKGWKPNWDNYEEYKWKINIIQGISIYCNQSFSSQESIVYFKTKELAQQAVEILGEDTIKLALSMDY